MNGRQVKLYPFRVAAQAASGIWFIGAGTIILRREGDRQGPDNRRETPLSSAHRCKLIPTSWSLPPSGPLAVHTCL